MEQSRETLIEQHLIDSDLIRLRKMLETHDWYYDYSDDHRYWTRGRDEARDIRALRESLNARGVNTDELYAKYCPWV